LVRREASPVCPPEATITFDDHALAALPNTAQIFGATIDEVAPKITLSLPIEPAPAS